MQWPLPLVTAMPGGTDQSLQLPDKSFQLAIYSWRRVHCRLSEQSLPVTSHCCLTHMLAKLGLYLFGLPFQSLHVCWTIFLPGVPYWCWGCAAGTVGLGRCLFCGWCKTTVMRPEQQSSGARWFLPCLECDWEAHGVNCCILLYWQRVSDRKCFQPFVLLLLEHCLLQRSPVIHVGLKLYLNPLTASILNFSLRGLSLWPLWTNIFFQDICTSADQMTDSLTLKIVHRCKAAPDLHT